MPLSFLGLLKWFIAVVSVLLLSGLARSTAQGQTLLTGGGATFPHPIYARWIAEFQKLHPDIEIEYNAIGSGAGIREIIAGVFDFGASDGPMDDAQLKNTVQSEAWRSCAARGQIVSGKLAWRGRCKRNH
jgi:ABC-type phosphate transport system substrate-binding protein